jgi:hypothetical protein
MLYFSLFLTFLMPKQNDCLCGKNEHTVFSFLTKNQKIASICTGANDAYLVYRFGTKDKIEMQYPAKLDKSSWKKFEFQYYFRGGGVQNAGIEENHLSFINNGIRYTVFQDYTAENNQLNIGIMVETHAKTVEIKGMVKTKKGDLSVLKERLPTAEY